MASYTDVTRFVLCIESVFVMVTITAAGKAHNLMNSIMRILVHTMILYILL